MFMHPCCCVSANLCTNQGCKGATTGHGRRPPARGAARWTDVSPAEAAGKLAIWGRLPRPQRAVQRSKRVRVYKQEQVHVDGAGDQYILPLALRRTNADA